MIAYLDSEKALKLASKDFDQQLYSQFEYELKLNEIASIVATYNPELAWRIYQKTAVSSGGKIHTLFQIILYRTQYFGTKKSQFLVNELSNIISSLPKTKEIEIKDLEKFSELYPQETKDLLFLLSPEQVEKSPEIVFRIIENITNSFEQELDLIKNLEVHYVVKNPLSLRAESIRTLLYPELLKKLSLKIKGSKLFSIEGLASYFYSLNPESGLDDIKFKCLVNFHIIPREDIKALIEKSDRTSLLLTIFLLTAKISSEEAIDYENFNQLIALAKTKDESIKNVVIGGLKFLTKKF